MKIQLNKQKNEDYTIIIGCGRLGTNLANTLSDNGEDVLTMLIGGGIGSTAGVSS